MALSLEECDLMIQTAKESNRMLTVFQNRRWDGDFLTVQNLAEIGALGTLRWIESNFQKAGISSKAWKTVPIEQGGGTFLDIAPHVVDQALVLLSPMKVTSVFCRMQFDYPEAPGVDSNVMLTLGFEDGCTVVLDTSSNIYIRKPRFYVCGSKGTFVKYGLDPQEDALAKGNILTAQDCIDDYGKLAISHTLKPETVPTLPGRWVSFYENVSQVLNHGADLLVTPESVRRQVAVIVTALQSAKEGKVINVQI
eukprot:TRINITY_DN9037_c0_g1::TRINITY_DN9037_c0_g1_i1::g.18289::m.18289 TRINITY_DN9037_c0_g1::TRINITY_DN9037_c0_g1_i1::g.18289  ORF type:complete len:252 (+),score=45.75,sp/O32223/IOLW_BACSU/30.00/9e-28,GFO_IDH_MocA_C/PF02894.12/1.7e-08 TRINITY_DN9037_c0_g1_i1:343-1098(+)